ncbi:MAG: hypothetical protein ACXVUE_05640 [Solirubrobacteraceae bacterium]
MSCQPARARSITMAALVSCVTLVVCGSSGKTATTAASVSPGLQLARCMRAHGVSGFPDPSSSGEIAISPGETQSPAFRSAQQACRRFSPKLDQPPSMSASERAQALTFAKCMRSNGQTDFPDTTLTAPRGVTRILVLRGMVFALGPGINPKSPAFRQAAPTCGVTPPGSSR